ncbi:MAG: N-acetyltransferase family protein [Myxococcota bacterium]
MDTTSVVIRTAKPGDVFELADLEVRSWRAVYGSIFPASELRKLSVERRAISWARQIDHPGYQSVSLVADTGDGVVGFLQCGPARGPQAGGNGEIYSIYVDPEHWGAGVGTALMDIAFDFLAARFDQAVLWVVRENESARRFYKARGFHADQGSLRTYTFFNFAVLCARYSRSLASRRTFDWSVYSSTE